MRAVPEFESVWKEILRIARENRKIPTLDRNVINEIRNVTHNSIRVVSETKRRERTLKREQFKIAWEFLVEHGILGLEEAASLGLIGVRSIMFAILARLPYVEYSTRPLTLRLREDVIET